MMNMKVYVTLFVFFISLFYTNAQVIKGNISDSLSNEPIAYVNIGIIGKYIGTVSNDKGDFELAINNVSTTDTLKFSIIGYEPQSFLVSDLTKPERIIKIKLVKRVEVLSEVIVTPKTPDPAVIGIKQKWCYPIPLYKGASSRLGLPSNDLGQEIGTIFSNKGKLIKLDSVQLNFSKCLYDSVTFRLNVYSKLDESIKNILNTPLYFTMSKDEILKSPVIDLSGYDLVIDTDFVVTIENIKNIGGLGLYFFANFKSKAKKYPTIYRKSSQSNWQYIRVKSKEAGISLLAYIH